MVIKLSEMNLPRFPLLTDQEMVDLLKRSQQGDQAARERLINCNLKLVFNLVQRFENRGYELEDLFQIGVIGLMKAIDKFDLNYNVKFSTYAVPMIIGEIRRFLRDDGSVKVSRSLKETAFKVGRVREEMLQELGREPAVKEIAARLGVEEDEIVLALEAVQMPGSINETLYQDEGDAIYLLDQLSDGKESEEKLFDRMALKEVLAKLPEKHQRVILMRFFEDKTQIEVAQAVGISQVQVSRIERQALRSLRRLLDGEQKPGG